jgi:hypothetical protein
MAASPVRVRRIDRLMPVVLEIEQILDRENSCLKSRAQISDGSERRFFLVCAGGNLALILLALITAQSSAKSMAVGAVVLFPVTDLAMTGSSW